jgi:Caudovirus prohead serine protease
MEKITKSLKTTVQDVNEAKGIVTIQITQFDKYDSDNDRLLKGALNKTWKEGSQVHLVDHKMGTATYVGLPVKRDSETGIIESQLNLKKQVAIDLLEDYKFSQEHGRSLQHSHGFMGISGKYVKNDKGGRDFSEIKQFEYSTVLFGAVSDTPLHGIKSNEDAMELAQLLELKLKTLNYTDEYAKLIEQKIAELKAIIKEPGNHSLTTTEPSGDTQKNRITFI